MIFRGGWVVSDWVWGWGVGSPDPKNNNTYLLTMFILSFQSNVDLLRFGTKYT